VKKPRVLHIGKFYPPHKGGMETHLQELCHGTSHALDIEVVVSNSTPAEDIENDGPIRVHRVGTLAMLASAPICLSMSRVIRTTPADIVHLHSPNPTAVLSYFASGHNGKLVVTHHSDIIRQRLLKFGYEPWLRRLMSRAERIICFSPNYLESSAILKSHRDKCRVIPHGVNRQHFEKPDPRAVSEIRERFGKRIVLGLGRLVYYKGFEFLIRAVASTDATLLLIGTGPLREKLETVVRECGASNRVHLLGEVDDPGPYYHAARMFALPATARSEAFGIVQVEAMACGTPVINTNIDSGVPYVSVHNVSGLTVPPGDVPALRQAIDDLLNNDTLHRRLSAGGIQRVSENFTTARMAEQTIRLYEDVLSGAATPLATGARAEIPDLQVPLLG
jgi:glycosyltransferase involved in cell wall biosynthesis